MSAEQARDVRECSVCPVCQREVVVGIKVTGRVRLSRHTLPGSREHCRGSRHTLERAAEIAQEIDMSNAKASSCKP
jgi:hypothetical protein